MSQHTKRKLDAATRFVSPPNTKRQRSSSDKPTPNTNGRFAPMRIFSWNVNGVRALLQKQLSFEKGTVSPLRGFLARHNWPHLLCLQEVKISLADSATQRHLKYAANSGAEASEPTYVVHFSLPRDKYNATGFGGKVHGVATLVRQDFDGNVLSTKLPDWDLEGRVLIHNIEIKGRALSVINGYWVNGTSNPYRNTETGEVQDTRHDHKLRFHTHMLGLIKSLRAKGKHVILIGDMNVAPSEIDGHPNLRTYPTQHVSNRADFNEKFFTDKDGFQGIDVFRHLHGNVQKYTYHPRGVGWGQSCDRVDNIIVDRQLFSSGAVVRTDICDNPLDRGHSDHVPLWVEVDIDRMPHPQETGTGDGGTSLHPYKLSSNG